VFSPGIWWIGSQAAFVVIPGICAEAVSVLIGNIPNNRTLKREQVRVI